MIINSLDDSRTMGSTYFLHFIEFLRARLCEAVFPRSFARIMYKTANQFSEVAWYICEQCLSKLIEKKLELYTYAQRRPETYSFVGLIMRWLYGVVRTRVRVTHLGTFVIRFIMQLSADTRRTHGSINAVRSAHSTARLLCNIQETFLSFRSRYNEHVEFNGDSYEIGFCLGYGNFTIDWQNREASSRSNSN